MVPICKGEAQPRLMLRDLMQSLGVHLTDLTTPSGSGTAITSYKTVAQGLEACADS